MPTRRGFIEQIEVGRAGLVRVSLIHANDNSVGIYIIQDLDADPERFNERLSTLGILRDAMNRAEPVVIEFISSEAGNEIQVAARISRDALAPFRRIEQVAGLVMQLQLLSQNGATAAGERHDLAQVVLLTNTLETVQLMLDLQAPERSVVNEQFEMLYDAHIKGLPVRLLVEAVPDQQEGEQPRDGIAINPIASAIQVEQHRRIIAVAIDSGASVFGRDRSVELSGFVESLDLIGLPSLVSHSFAGSLAHVRFTTAPEFTGTGNTVGLDPFEPTTLDLLLPKNSLTYDLFKEGLSASLRMRVNVVQIPLGQPGSGTRGPETVAPIAIAPPTGESREGSTAGFAIAEQPRRTTETSSVPLATSDRPPRPQLGIAVAAELIAPLASASRPVWIAIARESLDWGPDGYPCTSGLPSSDLTPMSLRDLRIPYPAVWRGIGCFNHGVYRFQFKLPTAFTIKVDNLPLCLHDATAAGIKLAYACLGGEHQVTVEMESWICDFEFVMDVYRIR